MADIIQPTSQLGTLIEQQKADEDFLEERSRDFKRLQEQKARKNGGVEGRVLQALAFDWGEQYVEQRPNGLVISPHEENKLYLCFNFIYPRRQKLVGRLSSAGGQFSAQPDKKDPKSLANAEVVDKLILALDEKLDQPMRQWELFDWLTKGGVAFEYVPWIPNVRLEPIPQFDEQNRLLFKDTTTDAILNEDDVELAVSNLQVPRERFEIYEEIERVGDVGSEILSPLSVFVDQSVTSLDHLSPDQWVYVAKIRTRGWIEENFKEAGEIDYGGDLNIVTTTLIHDGAATASMFLKDLIPTLQGTSDEDDPDMAVVVEGYAPASETNPRGRQIFFIPFKTLLKSGENPYEEIPIVDFHWQPVTTTFWTKDYITDLLAPQRFLNKRLSQLGEQSNASIYDKILLGPGLSPVDIPADFPGFVKGGVNEQGLPLVQRLPGPDIGNFFLPSIEMVARFLNDIAGGSDLFEEHKFPGQLRGPMAVPMLQEIIDTEWGPFFNHVGQRMARVKQLRLNRVKKHYPPVRTLHYTDKTQRDEVMIFHKEEILDQGTNYSITIERGSLLPELRALREARVRERLDSSLRVLYMDDRTGQIDKSKVAADLHMGDFGREGRESQSRKFAGELIEKLWKGEQVPPVMAFWDHEPMMDELEAAMMTTEFLSASQTIQEMFVDRWNQHNTFLQQKAEMMAASMQNQMVQGAVAQATQQTAATAAAEAVRASIDQIRQQVQAAAGMPETVTQALARAGGGQGGPEGRNKRQDPRFGG